MKKRNLLMFVTCLIIAGSLHAQIRLDVAGDAKIHGKMELIQAVGDSSLFIGANAGINDDGYNENTFVGTNAGFRNTSGSWNTFLGRSAGFRNTSGFWNTFLGRSAGSRNTSGSSNTFLGSSAGSRNTTGGYNTFLGRSAGSIRNNTRSTMLGYDAETTDSLDRAIAIGHNAVVGCHNCAVIGGTEEDAVKVGIGTITPTTQLDVVGDVLIERGEVKNNLTRNLTISGARNFNSDPYASLNFNNIDDDSASPESEYTGAKITSHNDDSSDNGDLRFFTNNSGTLTQRLVINGTGNVGIGTSAPLSDLHIKQRVAGTRTAPAGLTIEIAANANKWKVYHSGTNLSFAENTGSDNSTGLKRSYIQGGTGAYVREDGQANFGGRNASRFKEDILTKLAALPIRLHAAPSARNNNPKNFLLNAVEVQKLFPEMVRVAEDGTLGMAYADFGILAIKAIQELQAKETAQEKEIVDLQKKLADVDLEQKQNDAQQTQINDQQQQIDELKSLVEQLQTQKTKNQPNNNYELALKKTPALQQNQPNPFRENTLVNYYIPTTAQNAHLQVTSVDGKVLGTVNIQEKGQGQVTIKAAAYPAGTYYYSLIVDGEVFETKRMVLTK